MEEIRDLHDCDPRSEEHLVQILKKLFSQKRFYVSKNWMI